MRRRDLLRAAAVSPLAVGLSDRPRAAAEANAAGLYREAVACETPAGLAKIHAEEPADEDGRKSREGLNAFVRGRTYIEVKRALFLAAIAVSAGGPGAVAAVPDPTDGEPFALRSWASGFELTSRFTLDFKEGKPRASLIAGRK